MDPKIWKLERFPIAFFKNRVCQPRAHQSKKNPPRAKQRIYWFFEMVEDCWSKLSVSIQLKNCSAMRKPNEHTKFLFKNANWTLKFKSWIFQLHWGYLQMKPEILIFWDPVFGAWLWTTWAPLLPSKLNLGALTRSILTIKFRNPTRPPQIIKPSSKKPVKCVKASVPWTITHLHDCSLTDKSTSATPSSTPHSQLSPFYSRFSVPLQIFTITRIQNPKQIEKIQKCEAEFQQFGKNNTILSTLHLCTLQIFTITQTQKID